MLIDRRALSLAVPAAALFACLAVVPAAAKDTGLIFVSNEKSNNLIVIDPKTYKVIKDIKTSRRPRDVRAGVPMRMPLGSIGLRASKGIMFLFTVIPARSRAWH